MVDSCGGAGMHSAVSRLSHRSRQVSRLCKNSIDAPVARGIEETGRERFYKVKLATKHQCPSCKAVMASSRVLQFD